MACEKEQREIGKREIYSVETTSTSAAKEEEEEKEEKEEEEEEEEGRDERGEARPSAEIHFYIHDLAEYTSPTSSERQRNRYESRDYSSQFALIKFREFSMPESILRAKTVIIKINCPKPKNKADSEMCVMESHYGDIWILRIEENGETDVRKNKELQEYSENLMFVDMAFATQRLLDRDSDGSTSQLFKYLANRVESRTHYGVLDLPKLERKIYTTWDSNDLDNKFFNDVEKMTQGGKNLRNSERNEDKFSRQKFPSRSYIPTNGEKMAVYGGESEKEEEEKKKRQREFYIAHRASRLKYFHDTSTFRLSRLIQAQDFTRRDPAEKRNSAATCKRIDEVPGGEEAGQFEKYSIIQNFAVVVVRRKEERNALYIPLNMKSESTLLISLAGVNQILAAMREQVLFTGDVVRHCSPISEIKKSPNRANLIDLFASVVKEECRFRRKSFSKVSLTASSHLKYRAETFVTQLAEAIKKEKRHICNLITVEREMTDL
ncbi:hypothetical protein WN51_05932 [Melipona quadrifasciata]|uniref:Uncharacterized protein n=1 Tax=Melipona quadrifasciata TaxID=166423 RepID=A0A0N0U6V0_9HYME|nr:hypothetical protein WN51_05932 [Melipona quadrifasciata]